MHTRLKCRFYDCKMDWWRETRYGIFKSDASKYDIVGFTPYGQDVVDAFVKAYRKHRMKFEKTFSILYIFLIYMLV